MKRIKFFILLAITIAAFIFSGPSLAKGDYRLSPETKDKLEKLREKEDLTGIIRLWEKQPQASHYSVPDYFLKTLALSPRERFIAALLEGAGSKRQEVADACLKTLVALKEKRAVDIVIQKIMPPPLSDAEKKKALEIAKDLGHEEWQKRYAARKKLKEMGPDVIEVLKPLTKHYDIEVAMSAGEIISEVTSSLRQKVTSVDLNVLDEFNDPVALPAVRILVTGKILNDGLYPSAVVLLGKLGTPEDAEIIRPLLKGKFAGIAICVLGTFKDEKSVPFFIGLIKDEHADPSLQSCASGALRRIGDPRAIKPLEDALKRISPTLYPYMYLRADYIAALAGLGKRQYLHEMLADPEIMKDGNVWRRTCSVWSEKEIDLILKCIEKQSETTDRFRIIDDLIDYLIDIAPKGDDKIIATVRKARKRGESLKSGQGYDSIRFSALLVKLGDADEEKAVLRKMQSRDIEAIKILKKTGEKRFVPLLLEACKDKDTRHEAISAITRISGVPFDLWDFDRDRQVREIKAWWKKYRAQMSARSE